MTILLPCSCLILTVLKLTLQRTTPNTPTASSNSSSPMQNPGGDASYDPYKAAYASMPASAASNHEVKQQYVNGHFCYAYKFGILTNGLWIVRSIDLYNRAYLEAHPDIEISKKSKSPDEDKSLANSKALIPTLKDFKRGIH